MKITRFIRRLNDASSRDYSRVVRNELYRERIENTAYNSEVLGLNRQERDEHIVVSLTTYGERIYTVYKTIESIMEQSVKADRIILWLSADEFSLNLLPEILKKMMVRGLEIKFCKDLRSYKKLIPTIKLCPDNLIITVDDDMIYPKDMIEGMYKTHLKYPDCIVFNYGCEITLDKDKNVLPYDLWKDYGDFTKPSLMYMGIGVGGIMYSENLLHGDVVNEKDFKMLAPFADDLWFKIMAYRKNVKYVQNNFAQKILRTTDFLNRFITVEDEQREKLGNKNVADKKNDIQLSALIKKYDIKF